MNRHPRLLAGLLVTGLLCQGCQPSPPPRLLLFTKTAGFRHSSIATGKAAILRLGAEQGFIIDTTEDANRITEDSLRNYAAVIFLHTTGPMLERRQQVDLERFIQAGGGFVGIHAAADAEYDWRWYGRLVGGYFEGHPPIQEAALRVADPSDASTKHLPAEWKRKDEWYNFKRIATGLAVLLTIDERSYQGGTNGPNHPMSWRHEFDGGRAWYTALGHTEESYADPQFLQHLLGGIRFAIGKPQPLDYAKAKSLRVPPETQLVRTTLAQGRFTEPTEISILPNLDVLIAQRRGEVLLYRAADSTVKQVGLLNVYWKTKVKGVNAEEGLLGIKADPDFGRNHFVYVFYSPAEKPVNRLSRFRFENDQLDRRSEKVVLEVSSQRDICCHTGGSIAFGPDSNLYVSTGDNSTPFDEPKQRYVNHGFAPLDDRPGHEQYDARRSSGNTNDLRGKILRIRVQEDGSYTIPPGNLFPPGTANTRSEIYVMGCRNPYRISIDPKTGYLYWGDVGPDADKDSLGTRGPRGYDEINQAREPGFFGWPLFVGDNYAYYAYDYEHGVSGAAFDPAKPTNDSRNNTGLRQLPPAQGAFIWYPYADSPDFPQADKGGRTALAGPVYYADRYPAGTRLPAYYDGKLFIYDWIRHWIKAVTLQPNGDFDTMEPVLPAAKFAAPIDMELGPDGRIYVMEYGLTWFAKNPDAALSRIEARP